MSLGQPWALALLALALPILAVYALRGQPRRRPTTAAFLWRGLEQQTTARRRWQRPPVTLPLLLQLLALLVGVIALAQPSFQEQSPRQLVYLLDASASMQATDVAPNRFEAARAAIRAELAGLHQGEQVTLIRLADQPQVVVSSRDPGEVARALDGLRAGLGAANLRDGLAAALRAIEQPVAAGSEAVVFSDGAFPDPVGIGPFPMPVRFVRIGERGNNQGVSILQVRRSPGPDARLAGFAQVTNYANAPVRAPIRILADGVILETRLLDLPPRGRAAVPFDLPSGTQVAGVALGGRDDLPLDDRAEVTVADQRQRSVLLVSPSPEIWQQVLGTIPGLHLIVQSPEQYQDPGAEIVLLDHFIPSTLPKGQLVVVNPPPGNPLIEVLGEAREVRLGAVDPAHPLLRSIDVAALRLNQAERLAIPRWATPVALVPGGGALLDGLLDDRRVIVMGFDPTASGLDKLVAFPMLVANTVAYLDAAGTDPVVQPGRTVTVPLAPDAREVTLETPDGSRRALRPGSDAVKIETGDQVGRYVVRQRLPSGEVVTRAFFVQLFGEGETDTTPRDHAALAPSQPLAELPTRPGPAVWQPFVALGALLLGAEWVLFSRRR